jgi:hypothetical protein
MSFEKESGQAGGSTIRGICQKREFRFSLSERCIILYMSAILSTKVQGKDSGGFGVAAEGEITS